MDLELARHNMIVQQIRPWDVSDDDVLELMEQMPREAFVPDLYRHLAFADTEIPIGHGQSMMAPKLEARVLQTLQIRPGDRVLEIGTGSGYLTACLSWLSGDVTSIEIYEDFTMAAAERLRERGIDHVTLLTGDAMAGPVAGGPFDVIAVTGALPAATDHFERQLKEGGRLFQVTGEGAAAEAQLVTCIRDDVYRRETLFETALAPLINATPPEAFVF
jgi:protein-L-isoaspartate(D-aspartate) O-methyltransferase